MELMRTSPALQVRQFPLAEYQLFGGKSTVKFRPLEPVNLCHRAFDVIHGGRHPGRRATSRLISAQFVWPGLAKEVTAWAKECLACRCGKVYGHVNLRAAPIYLPSLCFAHLHEEI